MAYDARVGTAYERRHETHNDKSTALTICRAVQIVFAYGTINVIYQRRRRRRGGRLTRAGADVSRGFRGHFVLTSLRKRPRREQRVSMKTVGDVTTSIITSLGDATTIYRVVLKTKKK